MVTLLTYVVALLLVGGLLFLVASFAFGRGEEMAPALPEGTPVELPDDRPAGGADLQALRLSVVLRGYRMDEVDWVLDRLAEQVDARDREIARLRSALQVEAATAAAGSADAGPPDNGSRRAPATRLLTHDRSEAAPLSDDRAYTAPGAGVRPDPSRAVPPSASAARTDAGLRSSGDGTEREVAPPAVPGSGGIEPGERDGAVEPRDHGGAIESAEHRGTVESGGRDGAVEPGEHGGAFEPTERAGRRLGRAADETGRDGAGRA